MQNNVGHINGRQTESSTPHLPPISSQDRC